MTQPTNAKREERKNNGSGWVSDTSAHTTARERQHFITRLDRIIGAKDAGFLKDLHRNQARRNDFPKTFMRRPLGKTTTPADTHVPTSEVGNTHLHTNGTTPVLAQNHTELASEVSWKKCDRIDQPRSTLSGIRYPS